MDEELVIVEAPAERERPPRGPMDAAELETLSYAVLQTTAAYVAAAMDTLASRDPDPAVAAHLGHLVPHHLINLALSLLVEQGVPKAEVIGVLTRWKVHVAEQDLGGRPFSAVLGR